jgi:hypothetical protein
MVAEDFRMEATPLNACASSAALEQAQKSERHGTEINDIGGASLLNNLGLN